MVDNNPSPDKVVAPAKNDEKVKKEKPATEKETKDTVEKIEQDRKATEDKNKKPADDKKVEPKQTPPQPKPEPKKVKKEKPIKITTEPPVIEDIKKTDKKYFYLRIIALPYHDYYKKRTDKILAFLKKKGIKEANARKSSNSKGDKFWVIDIGKYENSKSKEAQDLHTKIQEMRYEGIKQFKDALFIRY